MCNFMVFSVFFVRFSCFLSALTPPFILPTPVRYFRHSGTAQQRCRRHLGRYQVTKYQVMKYGRDGVLHHLSTVTMYRLCTKEVRGQVLCNCSFSRLCPLTDVILDYRFTVGSPSGMTAVRLLFFMTLVMAIKL